MLLIRWDTTTALRTGEKRTVVMMERKRKLCGSGKKEGRQEQGSHGQAFLMEGRGGTNVTWGSSITIT